MGRIINPLLNRYGSKVFWRKTDLQLTRKDTFLPKYMLYETLEQMLRMVFTINTFCYTFGRMISAQLALANSRTNFEEYVNTKLKVAKYGREQIPYKRYYEIFTRIVFKRLGLHSRTKESAAIKIRARDNIMLPCYIGGEYRLQDVFTNVVGFLQKILIIDLEILHFPVWVRYRAPDAEAQAAERRRLFMKSMLDAKRPPYGRMITKYKFTNRQQTWRFYEKLFLKKFLYYNLNYKPKTRRRYFKVKAWRDFKPKAYVAGDGKRRKKIKASLWSRFKVKRGGNSKAKRRSGFKAKRDRHSKAKSRSGFKVKSGRDSKFKRRRRLRLSLRRRRRYRLRKLYRTLRGFLRCKVKSKLRRFERRIRVIKRRLGFMIKFRKYSWINLLRCNVVRLFAAQLHAEGLSKVKFNLTFMKNYTQLNAQTLAEYFLDKVSKGYGLEQLFKYTKRVLDSLRIRRQISGYRICFAGRFTKRQIAVFRWDKQGRTGINTQHETMDYGHGIGIGKHGMYTIRIWLNLHSDDARRFKGRK